MRGLVRVGPRRGGARQAGGKGGPAVDLLWRWLRVWGGRGPERTLTDLPTHTASRVLETPPQAVWHWLWGLGGGPSAWGRAPCLWRVVCWGGGRFASTAVRVPQDETDPPDTQPAAQSPWLAPMQAHPPKACKPSPSRQRPTQPPKTPQNRPQNPQATSPSPTPPTSRCPPTPASSRCRASTRCATPTGGCGRRRSGATCRRRARLFGGGWFGAVFLRGLGS